MEPEWRLCKMENDVMPRLVSGDATRGAIEREREAEQRDVQMCSVRARTAAAYAPFFAARSDSPSRYVGKVSVSPRSRFIRSLRTCLFSP